jgi:transposase-like protein
LANKPKLNDDFLKEIVKEYDSGVTPADLAKKWGVHPTTIRRWLRSSGRELSRLSHSMELDREVKMQLRNILSKFNVKKADILISELDKHFLIEPRQEEHDSDFPIINLK